MYADGLFDCMENRFSAVKKDVNYLLGQHKYYKWCLEYSVNHQIDIDVIYDETLNIYDMNSNLTKDEYENYIYKFLDREEGEVNEEDEDESTSLLR